MEYINLGIDSENMCRIQGSVTILGGKPLEEGMADLSRG